jgi:hypothetical protein
LVFGLALLLGASLLARFKGAGLRNDALQMEGRGDEIEEFQFTTESPL